MKRIDYIIIISTIIIAISIAIVFDMLTENILPDAVQVLIVILFVSMISAKQDDIIYYVKKWMGYKNEWQKIF